MVLSISRSSFNKIHIHPAEHTFRIITVHCSTTGVVFVAVEKLKKATQRLVYSFLEASASSKLRKLCAISPAENSNQRQYPLFSSSNFPCLAWLGRIRRLRYRTGRCSGVKHNPKISSRLSLPPPTTNYFSQWTRSDISFHIANVVIQVYVYIFFSIPRNRFLRIFANQVIEYTLSRVSSPGDNGKEQALLTQRKPIKVFASII